MFLGPQVLVESEEPRTELMLKNGTYIMPTREFFKHNDMNLQGVDDEMDVPPGQNPSSGSSDPNPVMADPGGQGDTGEIWAVKM